RLHDGVLALLHRWHIEVDLRQDDAVPGALVRGQRIELAGIEQGLARDAADVQAGAAERGAFLDAGDLLAELGGADGGDVPARPGPDDDQIVTLGYGGETSRVRRRGHCSM